MLANERRTELSASQWRRLLRDDAGLGWLAFCRSLGLPDQLAVRVWQALSRQVNPEAQALAYALARLMRGGQAATALAMATLYSGPARPDRLLPLIENCVTAGWLARADARQFEETILAQTGAHGGWQCTWEIQITAPSQKGGRE
jgi:hypothetical protein